MPIQEPKATTRPAIHIIDNMSVKADVTRSKNGWDVLVVITRAPNLAPMYANALDIGLFDANEKKYRLCESPSGYLTEFGSSLSTSINARYSFVGALDAPQRLQISYGDQPPAIFELNWSK